MDNIRQAASSMVFAATGVKTPATSEQNQNKQTTNIDSADAKSSGGAEFRSAQNLTDKTQTGTSSLIGGTDGKGTELMRDLAKASREGLTVEDIREDQVPYDPVTATVKKIFRS